MTTEIKLYMAKWRQANKDKSKLYMAKWRQANKDKKKLYMANWYQDNKAERIAYALEWRAKHGTQYAEYRKGYNNTHKDEKKAYNTAYNLAKPYVRLANRAIYLALKNGVLIRPDICSACGVECKPEGHHDDYNFMLVVRWLCVRCHRQWHSINTPKIPGE